MAIADYTSAVRAKLIIEIYKKWLGPNSRVLDIGCGTGVVADEISQSLKIKICGCDIENYLIRKIPFKKMLHKSRLPFKSNEFDATMLNDVLHHTSYKNQEKLISEALRVSKDLLIFELKPTLVGKFSDYLINKIHNPKMEIPYTYRKPNEWLELFNKLGLNCTKKEIKRQALYPFSHVAFLVSRKR